MLYVRKYRRNEPIFLYVIASLLQICPHAMPCYADSAPTLPGVIISNNREVGDRPSIFEASLGVRFAGLSLERLSTRATHIRELNLPAELRNPIFGRRNLCRTARVKRIIRQTKRHMHCAKNYVLEVIKTPKDPFSD